MWDSTFSTLFSSNYIPHGHCYLWQTPLVGLHVISDFLIAIAYFSIPVALVYFVYKQQHHFPTHLILLFGLFISFCGLGHLLDIVTLWYPVYWVSGAIRAATAIVSCYTAIEIVILLPRFLALQDVEAKNKTLEAEATKRSAYEQTLERNQKIFRAAFYDIPIGMALVSLDGYFVEVNEAITKIVGYSSKELLSIDFQSITHPDDLQSDLTLVNDLLANNLKSYSLEKRYLHRSGRIIPIELNVSLLRDDDDNPLLFIAHIKDISERNRINASLQNAIAEAEAANRAKGDFLAMMSHEIRTPMNAMLGTAELMEETKLDEPQRESIETIRTSGKTLLKVINDILDFSKIESNKLDLDMGPLNIQTVVKDTVALFSSQAVEKGLSLSSSIAPSLISTTFQGDSVRLKQILCNLVSNSIKFTDAGSVTVQCQPIEQLSDRTRIQFSVSDTGIGIDKEKVGSLFEPFSQVDSSITRRFGGTGLGLSISKRLVVMMNGQLSVESRLNQGSTFHFFIELDSCNEEAQTLAEIADDLSQLSRSANLSDRPPLRVLLVEDIALNQKVALQMLASYGYGADVACDGEEAIAAVQNQSYDLVFMDVQMPKLGGIEATQKIRLQPDIHQPYIVAMTAHAMRGDREACLSAGMNDYIQKPISKHDIFQVLNHFSSHASAANREKTTRKKAARKKATRESEPSKSTANTTMDKTGHTIALSSTVPTLDTTNLESIGTERSFLIEVCDSFLADAPNRIHELETAIKQADAQRLVRTAHALKSLSSCVGAMRLFEICQFVENAGREGIEVITAAITQQIATEYDNVQLAVQNYKNAQSITL